MGVGYEYRGSRDSDDVSAQNLPNAKSCICAVDAAALTRGGRREGSGRGRGVWRLPREEAGAAGCGWALSPSPSLSPSLTPRSPFEVLGPCGEQASFQLGHSARLRHLHLEPRALVGEQESEDERRGGGGGVGTRRRLERPRRVGGALRRNRSCCGHGGGNRGGGASCLRALPQAAACRRRVAGDWPAGEPQAAGSRHTAVGALRGSRGERQLRLL